MGDSNYKEKILLLRRIQSSTAISYEQKTKIAKIINDEKEITPTLKWCDNKGVISLIHGSS